MTIGWIYNHFAIPVMTALDSGMIGSSSLAGLAVDWPRPVTQKDSDRHCKLAQLLPIMVNSRCAYRTVWLCSMPSSSRWRVEDHWPEQGLCGLSSVSKHFNGLENVSLVHCWLKCFQIFRWWTQPWPNPSRPHSHPKYPPNPRYYYTPTYLQ